VKTPSDPDTVATLARRLRATVRNYRITELPFEFARQIMAEGLLRGNDIHITKAEPESLIFWTDDLDNDGRPVLLGAADKDSVWNRFTDVIRPVGDMYAEEAREPFLVPQETDMEF
jgi:hypothetical protein